MKIKVNGLEIDIVGIQRQTEWIDAVGCGSITHEVNQLLIEIEEIDFIIFKLLCIEDTFQIEVNKSLFTCKAGLMNNKTSFTAICI